MNIEELRRNAQAATPLVEVGWLGRFPSGSMHLTKFEFEVRRWRTLGYPTWPVFTKGEPHSSDCAIYNGDALPVGPCDCGFAAGTSRE